jgi:STAS-like domain of unknown function (DUF4325)
MLHFAELSSNGRSKLPSEHIIRIASDFSETPFGRYRAEGPESGEVFREDLLIPALKNFDRVILDIDDVEGLPSSFLEEVMGGLIRLGYDIDDLRKRIEIVTTQPQLKFYTRLAWRHAEEQVHAAD